MERPEGSYSLWGDYVLPGTDFLVETLADVPTLEHSVAEGLYTVEGAMLEKFLKNYIP